MQAAYEHGAWLVELAPLTDPDLVVTTRRPVFDLHGQTSSQTRRNALRLSAREGTAAHPRQLRASGHACARLAADLIAACPRLTILASSREGLGVYGETTYHLPTLKFAPANGETAEIGQPI